MGPGTMDGTYEGASFVSSPLRPALFREQIRGRFGELAEDFFAVYPTATEEEAKRSQFDMSRDQAFGIQMYTRAKMQTKSGHSGAWVYNWEKIFAREGE